MMQENDGWALTTRDHGCMVHSFILHNLPPHRPPRRQPPRNPSQGQPSPPEPRRTHPPPCPHPHTSAQRPSSHTWDRICGRSGRTPLPPLCCCWSCTLPAAPLLGLLLVLLLVAGSLFHTWIQSGTCTHKMMMIVKIYKILITIMMINKMKITIVDCDDEP